MSSDEVFVFLVCLVVGSIAWIKWYWQLSSVARLASSPSDRRSLVLAPLIAALLLFAVLKCLASHDVRNDITYLMFYMAMGAAWLGSARIGLNWFGLSSRDDVIERKNRAAAYAVAGGLIGIALCFAGGNIGDGPGWWVVIFAAALSTSAFFLLWIILNSFTGMADVVTIDRDPAAGIRLAGFFIAIGLILGRAVAGNWVSAEATIGDFVKTAWPVLLLVGAAIPMEKVLKPVTDRPFSQTIISGVTPALFYIVAGVIILILQGPWT